MLSECDETSCVVRIRAWKVLRAAKDVGTKKGEDSEASGCGA